MYSAPEITSPEATATAARCAQADCRQLDVDPLGRTLLGQEVVRREAERAAAWEEIHVAEHGETLGEVDESRTDLARAALEGGRDSYWGADRTRSTSRLGSVTTARERRLPNHPTRCCRPREARAFDDDLIALAIRIAGLPTLPPWPPRPPFAARPPCQLIDLVLAQLAKARSAMRSAKTALWGRDRLHTPKRGEQGPGSRGRGASSLCISSGGFQGEDEGGMQAATPALPRPERLRATAASLHAVTPAP